VSEASDDIEAVVGEPVLDQRPEPGPRPTLWIVCYAMWLETTSRSWWKHFSSVIPYASRADAADHAAALLAKGHRGVRIVEIHGDELLTPRV